MLLIKKIFKTAFPLILGGFLVWYSLRRITITELLHHFENANYTWIALGLFFGILSHFSRAYRWKYLLKPMGYESNYANSVMAVLVAYLVNLAIPRAGEISRATVMKNYEKIPFEKAFGTIVAERVSDVFMLLIIIGITLVIQYDFIYNLLVKKDFNFIHITILILFLGIGGYVFTSYIKKATKGFLYKIKIFINGLVEGILSIFKMKNKWSFIFHTIFIWGMYVAMFWATIPSIEGLEVPFNAVLVGFIAGSLSIAITNGGIGSYPFMVATAFSIYGVNYDLAMAFGWIMWLAQTLMIIVFGGLAFLCLPIYNRK